MATTLTAPTDPGPQSGNIAARSQLRSAVRAFAADPAGVGALIVFVALVVYAFVLPLLASPAATEVQVTQNLDPPSLFGGHGPLLGTDHLGRQLSVLVAEGLRTSLIVGVVVVLITAVVGWLVGAVGAYLGGWQDQVVGRFMDVLNIFPGVLIAVSIVSAIGGGLAVIILVLSLEGLVIFGRLGRTIALSGKHAEYVLAARMFGAGRLRVVIDHLGRVSLPAVLSLALVQLPQVILLEASLSFVGYGIQPPNTSIGLIVSDERNFIAVQPWPVVFAGAILALACVSLALIGIAGRKALVGTPGRLLRARR
jgi:ABC-type dipeptide/oligopeptide/nickel transport system permease subunit